MEVEKEAKGASIEENVSQRKEIVDMIQMIVQNSEERIGINQHFKNELEILEKLKHSKCIGIRESVYFQPVSLPKDLHDFICSKENSLKIFENE